MNYPCELIKDILPLYFDGVCNKATNDIVKCHLESCADCKILYEQLQSSDSFLPMKQISTSEDIAVLKGIKRRLLKKGLITVIATFAVSAVVFFGAALCLVKTIVPISYENISISVQDEKIYFNSLGLAMLPVVDYKVTETTMNGVAEKVLYFSSNTTLWNKTFSKNDRTYSTDNPFSTTGLELTLNDVSKIYYFTGDYMQFENISDSELEKIIANSHLLWSE